MKTGTNPYSWPSTYRRLSSSTCSL